MSTIPPGSQFDHADLDKCFNFHWKNVFNFRSNYDVSIGQTSHKSFYLFRQFKNLLPYLQMQMSNLVSFCWSHLSSQISESYQYFFGNDFQLSTQRTPGVCSNNNMHFVFVFSQLEFGHETFGDVILDLSISKEYRFQPFRPINLLFFIFRFEKWSGHTIQLWSFRSYIKNSLGLQCGST